MNKKAVISMSGGLDSTSLALHLLVEGYEVKAYAFNYGQKHSIELKKVQKNVKYLQKYDLPITLQIIDLRDCFNESASVLNKANNMVVPEGDYRDENMKSTVVENRNVIFSSIIYGKALAWANRTGDNVLISLGLHSGDHCFTGDTKILTPEGLKTVDTLNVGDKVFSLNPETQEICVDKCLDVIHKGFNNEIYTITTTSGDIRLTSEHEVYICNFNDYNKSKGYIKSISKKKVRELSVGDYMITSYKMPELSDSTINTINIKNIFESIDNHETFIDGNKFGFYRVNETKTRPYYINMPATEFVNLMAWYLSEGYTSRSSNPSASKYTSCFSQSMYKNVENCESIFNDLHVLDIPLSVTESKLVESGRPKEITYQFNSVISAIMQSCGCSSREKHIPVWLKNILYKSKDLRNSFIHTMCLGDGHYDEISQLWIYTSNSFELIQDLSELIKLNGYHVKLHKKNPKTQVRSISFGLKESKTGLVRMGDSAITKITNISVDTSKSEPVYDISVEKNHNFFAGQLGNVLISNSIYPDCRPESQEMAKELFRISNWGSEKVDYVAPFINIDKGEVLKAGVHACKTLGINWKTIYKNTISCYTPNDKGESCGKCGTCTERLEAFEKCGLKDPIKYQNL